MTTESTMWRWITRVALAAYVVIGFFPYLVSGLVVPTGAVVVLMACWAIGLAVTIRWARVRPMVAPAAVAVAIAFWFAFVSLGSAVFGWTA